MSGLKNWFLGDADTDTYSGLGYCILSQYAAIDTLLCPEMKIYNKLDLDNVNTLVVSVAFISAMLVFMGMNFGWEQLKLTIKEIEFAIAGEEVAVESDDGTTADETTDDA